MNPALKKEIDRLLALFESHGRPLTPKPMESDEPFHLMEKTTNIVLEPDVKDFYPRDKPSWGRMSPHALAERR